MGELTEDPVSETKVAIEEYPIYVGLLLATWSSCADKPDGRGGDCAEATGMTSRIPPSSLANYVSWGERARLTVISLWLDIVSG